MERKRAIKLFALSVQTGHYPIGTQVGSLKIFEGANCQSCMEVGKVEIFKHFLLYGPAFNKLRLRHLENQVNWLELV